MAIIFYPHEDELGTSSSIDQSLEALLESAQRFKAIVLDKAARPSGSAAEKKITTPRDLTYSYNWEEVSRVLRQIRELPEGSPSAKVFKADRLKKLAEVYEVLRAAKMAKLEAVRIALINEAAQLSTGSGSQVG